MNIVIYFNDKLHLKMIKGNKMEQKRAKTRKSKSIQDSHIDCYGPAKVEPTINRVNRSMNYLFPLLLLLPPSTCEHTKYTIFVS